MVIWNAKSGGGKAVTHHLEVEATSPRHRADRAPPGTHLEQLVRDAVAAGADGLAAAGGDGTQALVAGIAAEHDLPFACIPAGTRNHFALDLGVDRDDVVGALDAFVDGTERRVDLAEVNGRVFVNNVSLGLYAEAVQREGYRDAKLRTILDTAPDVLAPGGGRRRGTWTGPTTPGSRIGCRRHPRVEQRLPARARHRHGDPPAPGRRRPGSGGPGRRRGHRVAAVGQPDVRRRTRTLPSRSASTARRCVLDPPLRFVSRPHALRVRIAPHHPGASPVGDPARLAWQRPCACCCGWPPGTSPRSGEPDD